jgi:hypothetical protein
MPFGIILLILFFICYNFGGLERVNHFQPEKIVAYEGQNLNYDVTWHHWAGKG